MSPLENFQMVAKNERTTAYGTKHAGDSSTITLVIDC